MNTIETERLVRRIVATLKGEGDPAMAPKLAGDFQSVCAAVALRLEQCRSMIDAGTSVQAIHLAETQPNLLDLVTVLEFRQADEWRQFCRAKNLPCPETLPARDVSALNNCYNQGISPQHPVYAAYREAVLGRNDEAALVALKSIVRLNPADANAAADLAGLDAKILAERLARLDGLLNSDPAAALQELDSIEAFGFDTEMSGEIWRRAQLARSGQLLAEAEHLRKQGLLAETVTQLDFLTQLRSDHGLAWPPDWEPRVAALQAWCQTEAAAQQRDEEYRAATGQVAQAIMLSEEKDTRAKKVTIAELKADHEELHRRYRRVETFSRAVPDDLVQRFRKRSALLDQKIKRLSRTRLLLQGASAAACVLLLTVMAVAIIGLRRANALATELKKATAEHQVRTSESLLRQTDSRTILPTPKLKSASAAAAGEVASQLARLAEFEALFEKLPAQLGAVVGVDRLVEVAGTLNRANEAHRALSPDLQAETQPALAAFSRRWAGHCEAQLPSLNKELDERIAAAESAAAVLNDTPDLVQFRTTVAQILPRLEQASQNLAALAAFLKLRPELADRCQVLLERLRKDQAVLGRLDAALAALARADKTADVATAVGDLAALEIKQSEYARAARQARAVMALKEDPEAVSRALLVGTNSSLWEAFSKVKNRDLIPQKISSEMRQRFMELARDYAVNGQHYRCRLHLDPQLQTYEEWITDGPLLDDNSWHKTHGWTVQDQGPCEFGLKDYGVFGHKYSLAPDRPAYGVQVTDITAWTAVWTDSGFATLVDTRNLAYKLPPLKVADNLVAATNSAPLLRAYLLKELLGFMALQPLESGLVFSPQLRPLPAKLHALGADGIASGDWFVPSRIKTLQPAFEKFFAALQGVSFFRQASGLLNATTSAATAGFVLIGYARPDGQPVWKSAPSDSLVWGLPEKGDLPALLFVVKAGETRMVTKPAPLTPLLAYQGDLAATLKESGVQADDPSFKGQLPPLFAVPAGTL